jgi:hypothetical protein
VGGRSARAVGFGLRDVVVEAEGSAARADRSPEARDGSRSCRQCRG